MPYNISIRGNQNDSNLMIESAHGLISESSNPSPDLLQDVSDNSELLTQFQKGMQHLGGEAGGVNIYWAGGKSRLVPGVGQMYRFGDTGPGMFIRVPFDQEPVNNVSNYTGDPGSIFEGYYYQSIDDNIFRQWVLHLPKGKAKVKDINGVEKDEWGFYCIWDMATGIYSADYRTWKTDGSGPDPWMVAHANNKLYASEDEGWYKAPGYYTGANGEKWQSHIANFFAFSPEGARQLEAKRKEMDLSGSDGTFVTGLAPTKIVTQEKIAPLTAIVNATRPSVQLSKVVNDLPKVLRSWQPVPQVTLTNQKAGDLSFVYQYVKEDLNEQVLYDLSSSYPKFKETIGNVNSNNDLVVTTWNYDSKENYSDNALWHFMPNGYVDLLIQIKMKDLDGWINHCRIRKSNWHPNKQVNFDGTALNPFSNNSDVSSGVWTLELECEKYCVTYGDPLETYVSAQKIYLVMSIDGSGNAIPEKCLLLATWLKNEPAVPYDGSTFMEKVSATSTFKIGTVYDLDKLDKLHVAVSKSLGELNNGSSLAAGQALVNTQNAPPVGNFSQFTPLTLQKWMKAHLAADNFSNNGTGVVYSYPDFMLTLPGDDPRVPYEAVQEAKRSGFALSNMRLRSFLNIGPFIGTGNPAYKSDRSMLSFSVSSSGKNVGKLIATAYTGMGLKPLYHDNEIYDFDHVESVFLPGKDLSYNYSFDADNIAVYIDISHQKLYTVVDSVSYDTHIFFYKSKKYAFEYLLNGDGVNPSNAYGPIFNGDHIFIMHYKKGTSEVVHGAGANVGVLLPDAETPSPAFTDACGSFFKNSELNWDVQLNMDPIMKMGGGAAQREFMIKDPSVNFQGINVEDTRSANVENLTEKSLYYSALNFVPHALGPRIGISGEDYTYDVLKSNIDLSGSLERMQEFITSKDFHLGNAFFECECLYDLSLEKQSFGYVDAYKTKAKYDNMNNTFFGAYLLTDAIKDDLSSTTIEGNLSVHKDKISDLSLSYPYGTDEWRKYLIDFMLVYNSTTVSGSNFSAIAVKKQAGTATNQELLDVQSNGGCFKQYQYSVDASAGENVVMSMTSLNESFKNTITLKGNDTSLNLYASIITSPLEIDVSVNGTVGIVSKLSDAKYASLNMILFDGSSGDICNNVIDFLQKFVDPSRNSPLLNNNGLTSAVPISYFKTINTILTDYYDIQNGEGLTDGLTLDISDSSSGDIALGFCEIYKTKEAYSYSGIQWFKCYTETLKYYHDNSNINVLDGFNDVSLNDNLVYKRELAEVVEFQCEEWKKFFTAFVYLVKPPKAFEDYYLDASNNNVNGALNNYNGCQYSYIYDLDLSGTDGKTFHLNSDLARMKLEISGGSVLQMPCARDSKPNPDKTSQIPLLFDTLKDEFFENGGGKIVDRDGVITKHVKQSDL